MHTKKGIVTSTKMQKTAIVTVYTYKVHPKYKKRYRVSKKFMAENPANLYQEGETVMIKEARPLSKRKRWIITEKVQLQK